MTLRFEGRSNIRRQFRPREETFVSYGPVSMERINAHRLPFAQLLGIEFVSVAPDLVEPGTVLRGRPRATSASADEAIISFAGYVRRRGCSRCNVEGREGTMTLESKTNFVAVIGARRRRCCGCSIAAAAPGSPNMVL